MIIVLVGGVVYIMNSDKYDEMDDDFENELEGDDDSLVTETSTTTQDSETQNTDSSNLIDLSEYSKHSTESDCWVTYKGEVYDVTTWLPKHPGGVKAISRFCGIDGFEAGFIKKHGTSKESLFFKEATLKGTYQA